MKEEYTKQEDGSWIKKTTQEEVVDLNDKKLLSEIAYCDVQISNAQAIISEMEMKKTSLIAIQDSLSEKPLAQEVLIQQEEIIS